MSTDGIRRNIYLQISDFGIEPEPRGSYRSNQPLGQSGVKLDATLAEWLVTSVRTSRLGFDSRSQKSGDKYFSEFHQVPQSARISLNSR